MKEYIFRIYTSEGLFEEKVRCFPQEREKLFYQFVEDNAEASFEEVGDYNDDNE